MAEMKIYYFNVRARAEPIRLCMAAAGKKFEDVRLNGDQWKAEKAKSPFGSMPFIEYGGKRYGESRALANFAARECGLAGKTSLETLRVEEVYNLVCNMLESGARAFFEKDPAKKETMQKENEEVTRPTILGHFERLLKESGTGYFVGNGITLADLSVQDITFGQLKKNPKFLEGYPEIQKMIKKVEADPKIKAYMASRPVTD